MSKSPIKVPMNTIITVNKKGQLEMKPIGYIKKETDMGYIIRNYDQNHNLYICQNMADHHNTSRTPLPGDYINDLYNILHSKKNKKKSSTKKKKSSTKKSSTKV